MSGIYIPGLKFPNEDGVLTLRVWGNGMVESLDGYHSFLLSGIKAVPVPDHGRLIDADALKESIKEARKAQPEIADVYDNDYFLVAEWLASAPTVIPADPAEEGEG